jgi:hypothetical protein
MKPLLLFLAIPVNAEFHIGLYNLTRPKAAEEVAAAGFTHVLSGDPDVLAASLRQGLKVLGIPRPNDSPRSPSAFPVAAWYIADEPEINRQSPEDVARISDAVRRWDPGTPLALVVGDARFVGAYAPSIDAMMVDWYPVPHLALSSAGDQVSVAVAQAGGKPVWAVLQAMDWRDYPQRDPKKPRIGRFPTPGELRFMTYHSVVRGAAGVYYFEFQIRSTPGKTLLDYPERWQALKDVVKELSTLKEFFGGGSSEPVPMNGLEGRLWRHGGKKLAVLVNATSVPASIPKEFQASRWHALFSASLAPEQFSRSTLAPWQVAVLTAL